MRCYLKQRKENGIWYIHRYDPATGQCPRTSTGTRDRERADGKLAKFIIEQPVIDQLGDATLVKVLLRYYEHHGKAVFSSDTVRRVLKLVVEHEPETRLHEFTLHRQKSFAVRCGKTSSTQRRYMGVIRAAIQWSFDHGEIPSMLPILKIKAQDGSGVQPFSLDELSRLLASADSEHERFLLLLCLANAPRPGAALDLTWDRIDADTGVVNYNVPGRKITKKRRALAPLPTTARNYLEAHRSIGHVIKYNGKRMKGHKMTFMRIAERAKVKGTAYGVRKAVAIWLRREGVHEWDAKGILGHAIGGETERYAHYRPEYMRSAADAIERLIQMICPAWLASYLPAREIS